MGFSLGFRNAACGDGVVGLLLLWGFSWVVFGLNSTFTDPGPRQKFCTRVAVADIVESCCDDIGGWPLERSLCPWLVVVWMLSDGTYKP